MVSEIEGSEIKGMSPLLSPSINPSVVECCKVLQSDKMCGLFMTTSQ